MFYTTPGPVSTWMGDCQQAGKPSVDLHVGNCSTPRWFTCPQTVTHPSANSAVHDWPSWESNSQPVDHKSDALAVHYQATITITQYMRNNSAACIVWLQGRRAVPRCKQFQAGAISSSRSRQQRFQPLSFYSFYLRPTQVPWIPSSWGWDARIVGFVTASVQVWAWSQWTGCPQAPFAYYDATRSATPAKSITC